MNDRTMTNERPNDRASDRTTTERLLWFLRCLLLASTSFMDCNRKTANDDNGRRRTTNDERTSFVEPPLRCLLLASMPLVVPATSFCGVRCIVVVLFLGLFGSFLRLLVRHIGPLTVAMIGVEGESSCRLGAEEVRDWSLEVSIATVTRIVLAQ